MRGVRALPRDAGERRQLRGVGGERPIVDAGSPVGAAVVRDVPARQASTGRAPRRRGALLGVAVTAGVVIVNVRLPIYVHLVAAVSATIGALGGELILLVEPGQRPTEG